ncbi:MAG: ABC transporter ATP-binding protein [Desulfurococcales archaeon]|nr:ABC transporter ATP-binding protein [Desulfurococcales archaeon]
MLVVEGLEKRYRYVRAVRGVSFTVGEGEIVGLVGPNGAGKTTTLKSIVGLVVPDKGRILVDDVDPQRDPGIRRILGYVPEAPEAPRWPRVCDFLEKLAYLEGMSKNEARRRARASAEELGLTEYCNYKVGALSKGLRKRLLIAQSLLRERKYYVMDEPISGLDPEWVAEVRAKIVALAREGSGVLVSSHILRELEEIVTRVVIIRRGEVVFQGSLKELSEYAGGKTIVTIRSPNATSLARFLAERGYTILATSPSMVKVEAPEGETPSSILSVVEEAGFKVEGFEYSKYSLEDAYLRLVRGG